MKQILLLMVILANYGVQAQDCNDIIDTDIPPALKIFNPRFQYNTALQNWMVQQMEASGAPIEATTGISTKPEFEGTNPPTTVMGKPHGIFTADSTDIWTIFVQRHQDRIYLWSHAPGGANVDSPYSSQGVYIEFYRWQYISLYGALPERC